MTRVLIPLLFSGVVAAAATLPAHASDPDAGVHPGLKAAIAGPWRDPANVARDAHRHPGPTLAFFGADKKRKGGKLRFIVPGAPGDTRLEPLAEDDVKRLVSP